MFSGVIELDGQPTHVITSAGWMHEGAGYEPTTWEGDELPTEALGRIKGRKLDSNTTLRVHSVEINPSRVADTKGLVPVVFVLARDMRDISGNARVLVRVKCKENSETVTYCQEISLAWLPPLVLPTITPGRDGEWTPESKAMFTKLNSFIHGGHFVEGFNTSYWHRAEAKLKHSLAVYSRALRMTLDDSALIKAAQTALTSRDHYMQRKFARIEEIKEKRRKRKEMQNSIALACTDNKETPTNEERNKAVVPGEKGSGNKKETVLRREDLQDLQQAMSSQKEERVPVSACAGNLTDKESLNRGVNFTAQQLKVINNCLADVGVGYRFLRSKDRGLWVMQDTHQRNSNWPSDATKPTTPSEVGFRQTAYADSHPGTTRRLEAYDKFCKASAERRKLRKVLKP